MIKSIKIKNFQSHEESFIEFVPGVNALVGLSDNGKTTVLRALNWVINNRPLGEGFRSHWGGDTIVTAELGSGVQIQRGRTKNDNWYSITTNADVLQEFRAFGDKVPAEVSALFNLNELNLSSQMDAPFLLSIHPGEVAQTLNRVVNLDIIDASIAAIRKKKLSADTDLKANGGKLEALQNKLEALKWLDIAGSALQVIEGLESQRSAITSCAEGVKALLSKITTVEASTGPAKALAEAFGGVVLAESAVVSLSTLQRQRERLRVIHSSLQTAQQSIDKYSDLARSESEVSFLSALLQQQLVIRGRADDLQGRLRAIERRGQSIATAEITIAEDENKLAELMPEVCPLCGSTVKLAEEKCHAA
jgi:exonuclease SbcC